MGGQQGDKVTPKGLSIWLIGLTYLVMYHLYVSPTHAIWFGLSLLSCVSDPPMLSGLVYLSCHVCPTILCYPICPASQPLLSYMLNRLASHVLSYVSDHPILSYPICPTSPLVLLCPICRIGRPVLCCPADPFLSGPCGRSRLVWPAWVD